MGEEFPRAACGVGRHCSRTTCQPLDNSSSELRISIRNGRSRCVPKSRDSPRWHASLTIGKSRHRLGTYVDYDDAVRARIAAEMEHLGAVCQVNVRMRGVLASCHPSLVGIVVLHPYPDSKEADHERPDR